MCVFLQTSRFTDNEPGKPCNETVEHLRGLIGPRPPSGRGKLFNEFTTMFNSSTMPGVSSNTSLPKTSNVRMPFQQPYS